MSLPLVKYLLMAALRDRIFISLLVLLLVGASLSIFLGSAAVIEKDQFSYVFAAGGLRLAGMMTLILFVIFYIRRSFEAKDVDFILSRPVGRIEFVLSHVAGLTIMALLVGIAQGLAIYVTGPHLFSEGYVLWIFSVMMENVIMVNVAFFFAMILSSATSCALATLGMYVLCRLMGQLLGIVDTKIAFWGAEPLRIIMQGISSLLPRLDLMGQSSWLLYGYQDEVGYVYMIAQAVIFSALVVMAALIDFVRRQF